MSEPYLTDEVLVMIGMLRQRPVGTVMAGHLMGLFGKGGLVAQIAASQEAESSRCPRNGTRACGCGYCAPYRDGPLLDEVLAEIQAFERGDLMFNKKGEPIGQDRDELPF